MRLFGIDIIVDFNGPDQGQVTSLLDEYSTLIDSPIGDDDAEDSVCSRLNEIRERMSKLGYSYDPDEGFK